MIKILALIIGLFIFSQFSSTANAQYTGTYTPGYTGSYTGSYLQPPGTFSQGRPAPRCDGVNVPRYRLSWSISSNVAYYTVTAQSAQRGWQAAINVGNTNLYDYTPPAGAPADESWEFTIWAYNAAGQRMADTHWINPASSYYIYGWISVNCTSMPAPSTFGNSGCLAANNPYIDLWWGLPQASNNIIVTRTDYAYNSGIGNVPSWTPWREQYSAKANNTAYGYWIYYHNPTNLTDQSGRGFGAGWSAPGYVAVTTANCSPPLAFAHNTFSAFCAASMDPRINMSWSASTYASAYFTTPQSNVRGWFGQIPLGNTTSYQYDVPNGFWVNEGFEFTTIATNTYGSASTTGGSSYYTQGWTVIPPCYPPQAFAFTSAPAPACQALSTPQVTFSWSAAQYASYYTVTPQSNLRGVQAAINVGNVTSYTYNVPAGAPAGEYWEFGVTAYNGFGSRAINSGSSYYVYGWTPGAVCETPIITFTVNGQLYQTTISSGPTGTAVSLAYTAVNASSCSTLATPAWGLSGGFPTNPNVSPWGPAYGAAETKNTPPLINNPPNPQSSGLYTYTLTCTNVPLQAVNPGAASASKTLNVNVVPNLSPFIQTTEGDVHTNRNINVPN